MEEQITKKCVKIFNSCVLISHVEVANNFLELALKHIEPGTKNYGLIAESWGQLQERVDII
jgi:hypothetical protein